MYKQTLYKIHTDHLSDKKIKKDNKYKKFNYGYNEELDCVIISKDGTLGDIYEIQGLKVGIPKTPNKINGEDLKKEDQVFKQKVFSKYYGHILNKQSAIDIDDMSDWRKAELLFKINKHK